MKKTTLMVFLAISLAGCSTVNITYNIMGNENKIDTEGRVVAPKEISTAGSAYGDAASKEAKQ